MPELVICIAPELATLSLELDATSKFMKSPLNVDGFAPRYVPDALPPVMKFESKSTRVEVLDCGAAPAMLNVENGDAVKMPSRKVVLFQK